PRARCRGLCAQVSPRARNQFHLHGGCSCVARHTTRHSPGPPSRLGMACESRPRRRARVLACAELAALAAMRFDNGIEGAADAVDRQKSRPDFQALIYPGSSRRVEPTKESPPIFLACSFNDRPDISEGLAEVYLKFKKVGVPAELHIFASGGHGFGLRERNAAPFGQWAARFYEWLGDRGFLKKP